MMGRDYHRAWYQANKLRIAERARIRYQQNGDAIRAKMRAEYPARKQARLEKILIKKYGLTMAQYKDMLATQSGVCAICQRECTCGRSLAVDHNHATGKVRGLLCSRCNRGIGLFKESVDYMQSALNYLNQHTS